MRTLFHILEGLALLAALGISIYLFTDTGMERTQEALRSELASTSARLATEREERTSELAEYEAKVIELADTVYKLEQRVNTLEGNVEGVGRTVGTLSGSVRTLEKLTTTDPELLQKYSSVYFLNENYKPADLTLVEEAYDYVNGKQVTVHAEVWPFLEDMLKAATDDGVDLLVLSGYRSFDEQATLKNGYTVRFGVGANQFSADQGYSEHQLGTAIDITTPEVGEDLQRFEGTEAFTWLTKHAHEYGFALSYPKGNAYFMYEPWHWRFVGVRLAKDLAREERHLYELEQRELDEYIPTLFDR